ncbi:hypothetical protein Mgra_00003032 [Meloidogyne graminicola]|uniref:Uncharacterized protein n=1 Tax=Meloidogyne graminicola TaxID=189291 RepID=A0A8S9ZW47_9BILA|nr:hypothetical protein Mgra_00003032 [Meloidogyne graminicola]
MKTTTTTTPIPKYCICPPGYECNEYNTKCLPEATTTTTTATTPTTTTATTPKPSYSCSYGEPCPEGYECNEETEECYYIYT